jgi:hypothetical protein
MKEYEKWMRKAENDLLNIQNNLASASVPVDALKIKAFVLKKLVD